MFVIFMYFLRDIEREIFDATSHGSQFLSSFLSYFKKYIFFTMSHFHFTLCIFMAHKNGISLIVH